MATKSDKPQSTLPGRGAGRLPDYLTDPLPLPEVVESDTDTAWGRWEDTLKANENPDFSDTLPSVMAPLSDFENTKSR